VQTSVIIRLLDLVLLLLPRGIALYSRIEVVRDEIDAMGTENPTDEQWEGTGTRTDEKLARLVAKRSTP
jgi:hypothetical protein